MTEAGLPDRVAVLGFARSGKALASALLDRGVAVSVADRRPADAFPEARALASRGARLYFGNVPPEFLDGAGWLAVSPGVPLLSLVDLSDVWVRFDLREDLLRGLKIGDRFDVHMPALGDQPITVVVRKIATRGEYAGWRATRATGDFDLRTFDVRAYPVSPVPGLRPGMSVYVDWKRRP